MDRKSSTSADSQEVRIEGQRIAISNPGKVLYPAGFTKAQVIDYYVRVAPFILPHLHDRPITLKRCPDGVQGECFYEKNAPGFTPQWVKTFPVPRRAGGPAIKYILINDTATLAWAANLANLEIHPFLHRVPELDRPTSLVFDLDPGEGADVVTCAKVAFLLKQLFEQLGLRIFVKVSGSKGLQVYVPLNTAVTYDQTRRFACTVAEYLEQQHHKLVVSDMAKAKRAGKVFIDWSQNADFKTTVGVYSLRAKEERPYVSLPVTWDELERAQSRKDQKSLYFEPEAALTRLNEVGDLFAPVLELKQQLPESFAAKVHDADTPGQDPLQAYREKRDFSKTAEPRPSLPRRSAQGGRRRFVIQKHAASHLHYDFRLEMQDVLKSWAVPKGIPHTRNEKRLAMATEDHPLDYLEFEGTIPQGQYGGGTVMVWDIGTYEVMDGSYHKGKLHLFLEGKKLKGEWVLVKRGQTGDKNWLLIKVGEAATPPDDTSALSGRTLTKIAQDNDAQWQSHRRSATAAKAGTKPLLTKRAQTNRVDLGTLPKADIKFIEPMQCRPVDMLPEGDEWQYEIKWDGYRALVLKTKDGVTLLSRRNNSLNARFPKVVQGLTALDNDTIVDGEVVALDERGRSSFNLLQNDPAHAQLIVFYAFDLLAYQGKSLLALPLGRRRELLESALAGIPEPVRISEPVHANAGTLITAAREHGLEGLIAKRVNSVYEPGQRSGAWVKYKVNQSQELVIGGYVPGKNFFDALLVGYYEKDKLIFVAKIRNGFTRHVKEQVFQRFKGLQTDVCPFANLPEPKNARRGLALTAQAMKQCRWLKPKLVAQIEFTEWTADNHLRHAKFVALRDDKDAREVRRE